MTGLPRYAPSNHCSSEVIPWGEQPSQRECNRWSHDLNSKRDPPSSSNFLWSPSNMGSRCGQGQIATMATYVTSTFTQERRNLLKLTWGQKLSKSYWEHWWVRDTTCTLTIFFFGFSDGRSSGRRAVCLRHLLEWHITFTKIQRWAVFQYTQTRVPRMRPQYWHDFQDWRHFWYTSLSLLFSSVALASNDVSITEIIHYFVIRIWWVEPTLQNLVMKSTRYHQSYSINIVIIQSGHLTNSLYWLRKRTVRYWDKLVQPTYTLSALIKPLALHKVS